jgi:hypothetical protein
LAADKIISDVVQVPKCATLHFCIKTIENYRKLEKCTAKTVAVMEYYNKIVGAYPYKQYSV